ncbi:MAG: hypothetical protein IKE38_04765 [Erysipelotrichaceae bacterium]|nr:hypothetical protein [Erysipelotrichaceae bacterium]
MKKLTIILLALMTVLTLSGCQKKLIVATINVSDENEGGMQAEMNEKSTVKDLFDEYSEGADFTYELDEEGYVVSINGKENNELGYWEILLNGNLLDDVIGKTALNDKDIVDVRYIPNKDNPIVGGWEIAEVAREDLTEDEKANFEKAMEVVLGEDYEPVCVIDTQVVSGMNYAYLARRTTVSENPDSCFCVVVIYVNLDGEAELKSIADINIDDIQTREDTDEQILGGWEVTDTGKPGTLGSAEVQESFDKATKELVGVGYNPIQLIARQLVSGNNYIALVRGRALGSDDAPELYIMRWYEDLDGNSTVTDIKKFDLNYYVEF